MLRCTHYPPQDFPRNVHEEVRDRFGSSVRHIRGMVRDGAYLQVRAVVDMVPCHVLRVAACM